jgi:hypothetical protein
VSDDAGVARVVDELFAELARILTDAEVLLEQVKDAEQDGRRDDAVRLYLRWRCLRDDLDLMRDDERLKNEPEREPWLDTLRREAIAILQAEEE